MAGKKVFRDLCLNDVINIEVSVADALTAIAEYVGAEWTAPAMTHLLSKIQTSLLDPLYVKEQEAAAQAQADAGKAWMERLSGQEPDVPPHMEE